MGLNVLDSYIFPGKVVDKYAAIVEASSPPDVLFQFAARRPRLRGNIAVGPETSPAWILAPLVDKPGEQLIERLVLAFQRGQRRVGCRQRPECSCS